MLISALPMTAFAFKAQGVTLFLGVGLFVAVRQAIPMRRKLLASAVLECGGLAVAVTLWLIPNCWLSWIEAMRHHSLICSNLRTQGGMVFGNLWPFLLFPMAWLIPRLRTLSFKRRIWTGAQQISAPTCALVCMLAFNGTIQLLALLKEGGSTYDLELIFLLALPFVILSGDRMIRRRTVLVVLVSGLTAAGFAYSAFARFREAPPMIQKLEQERTYLSNTYPNAKLIYFSSDYRLMHHTNLEPVTDFLTTWHYFIGGFGTPGTARAISSQYYDLVLFAAPIRDAEGAALLFPSMGLAYEFYVPIVDPNMSAGLQGRLLKRRQPLRGD